MKRIICLLLLGGALFLNLVNVNCFQQLFKALDGLFVALLCSLGKQYLVFFELLYALHKSFPAHRTYAVRVYHICVACRPGCEA